MLYVKGISIMTAAGGAVNESLDSRFTNDATRFAGRCLWKCKFMSQTDSLEEQKIERGWQQTLNTYVELRKSSVSRKKRARCLRCNISLSRKLYSRV